MYPKINNLVQLLHNRGISTFLVTNAQFPEAIRYYFSFINIQGDNVLTYASSSTLLYIALMNLNTLLLIMIMPLFLLNRNLSPVTQLYVSVDASTKESLKKIDRPLFRDFWPRFLKSLEALCQKVTIFQQITFFFFATMRKEFHSLL